MLQQGDMTDGARGSVFQSGIEPYAYQEGAAPTEMQLQFAEQLVEPHYSEGDLAAMREEGMGYHDWYRIVPGAAAWEWVCGQYPDLHIEPRSVESSYPPRSCTVQARVVDGPEVQVPRDDFEVKVYYGDGQPVFSEGLFPLIAEEAYDAQVKEELGQVLDDLGVERSCAVVQTFLVTNPGEGFDRSIDGRDLLGLAGNVRLYVSPRAGLDEVGYDRLVDSCIAKLDQAGAEGSGTTWYAAYLVGFDDNVIGCPMDGPFDEAVIREVFAECNQGMRGDPCQWVRTGVL